MTAAQQSSSVNQIRSSQQKEEITFVPLTEEYVHECVTILTACFQHEPMCITSEFTNNDLLGFMGIHVERAARQAEHLSTVALVNGEVAAVCISEDLANPLVPETDVFYEQGQDESGKYEINMERWGAIFGMVGQVDEAWLDKHGRDIEKGKVFHQWLVGVSSKYGGQGLCRRILEANLEVGRTMGFCSALIECTGRYSLSASKKVGYEEQVERFYGDFVNPEETGGGGKVFSKTKELTGHPSVVLLTKELQMN